MLIVHQKLLRRCFCDCTGVNSLSGFDKKYAPIDKATVDSYAEQIGVGPKGATMFRLYFGDGWRTARWNRTVITSMLPVIHTKRKEARITEDLSTPAIEACLWDYIKQAHDSWSIHLPRIQGNKIESAIEAQKRANADIAARKQRLIISGRKRNVSLVIVSSYIMSKI